MKLFGINLKSFNLPEEYQKVNSEVHGVNQFFTEPGEVRVNFGNLKYDEEIVSRSYAFTMRAKSCYRYQTNIESNICVGSTQAAETGAEKVCVIDGEKIKSGDVSSAPIQVTSLPEKFFDDGENDKGIISLDNGAETVTCFRTVSVGEENYEDKINIKLTYKYVDRTSTTFNVFA